MHQVFISYSSADADRAREIVQYLENQGIPCWFGPRDLPTGDIFGKAIRTAIAEAPFFLLLLSAASVKSKTVWKELDTAITEGKRIIPLKIEDCELNSEFRFYLSTIQIWDFVRDPITALDAMIAFIKSSAPLTPGPETEPPASQPVVRHVFVSHSTADEAEALKLADHLLKKNVVCWMAPRDTRSHTSYPAQITQAVRECPIFLLLISNASMASGHVEREMALSIDKRIYAGNKYIIPLMLEDCALSDDFLYYLANQHYYPYFTEKAREETLAKITEQISKFIKADEGSADEYLRTAEKYNKASNYKEAEKWYTRAALMGNARAQSMLGYYYHTGRAGTRNIREAMKWYQKAADQELPGARANLGLCYAYEITPRDWKKAAELFKQAAEQGFPGAQRHLGDCYANERGVEKDLAQAKLWYQKAADQGDEDARKKLEKLK